MTKPTIAIIGIIGTGNVGRALARQFAKAGHKVFLGSRDAAKGAKVAADLGENVDGGSIAQAVNTAHGIVLAVPFLSVAEVLALTGPMDGKVVVDVTNPFAPDMNGLLVGHTSSAAEEIQALIPNAKVVKAFHLFFATWFDADKYSGGAQYKALIAGNDHDAKAAVGDIAASMGFDPVNVGPLTMARYLEPLAILLVKVGYDNLLRGPAP